MKNIYKKRLSLILLITSIVFLLSLTLINSAELKVTEEHPFYLDNKWVSAKDLKVGNIFKTIDGKKAVIKNIQIIKPKKPFWVFNLEVPFFNNFIVGPWGLIVHNSNVGHTDTEAKVSLEFIDTPNGKVPIPHRDNIPKLDRTDATGWADSALTDPSIPPDVRGPIRDYRMKIVDNTRRIEFEEFSANLESAVKEFNHHIGDEPYVMLVQKSDGSEKWAYDIASKWLKNKPSHTVSVYDKAAVGALAKEGNTRFVFFDDASYSGSRISLESGELVVHHIDSISEGNIARDLKYYAVVARASSEAEKRIAQNTIFKGRGTLLSGGDIRMVRDVIDPYEIDLMFRDEILDNMQKLDIREDHALDFFDHKVPDALSFPDKISDLIHGGPDTSTPFKYLRYEPYKQRGTDYYERTGAQ